MIGGDSLLERLADFDPARNDAAPEPGSRRRATILQRATGSSLGADHDQRGRRRPRRVAFGVAAAIVSVVVAYVAFEPDQSLSSATAVIEAAGNTADVLTLRSEYVRDNGDGTFDVVRSEHRGADLQRRFTVIEPDGTERGDVEGDEFVVFIGNKAWRATDRRSDATIVRPEERNAPYADAAAAVLGAVVTEQAVEEVGTEDVRGRATTHYRVELDDAAIRRLANLSPNELSGFELEHPASVRSLDVWVSDDFIHRIRLVHDWEAPDSQGTIVEFYAFGSDVTISPPG